MTTPIDETGARFGRLLVESRSSNTKTGRVRWVCACDCGKTYIADGVSLRNGHTRSCGCLMRDNLADRSKTHGETAGRKPSPEYRAWIAMKARCSDPLNGNYGARGISVHQSWVSDFAAFLRDMGRRPEAFGKRGLSVDRISNDDGYGPGNCRWANQTTQMRNTRRNRTLTIGDVSVCASEWAERTGIKYKWMLWRISRGWHPSVASGLCGLLRKPISPSVTLPALTPLHIPRTWCRDG